MTIIFCLASFALGAGVMAVYNLAHASEVKKLGTVFSGEFVKVKSELAKVVDHIEKKDAPAADTAG